MNYEIIIGLEVHVELKTKTKLSCGCTTEFGGEANTQVCPICQGHPGALPLLNKKAVEYSILTGLALNCKIADFCQFDRKQYFYPDLPKGYQITQYYYPIGAEGWLQVGGRKIGITRIHLEEEAARSYHSGQGLFDAGYTLLDDNRSNIPLLEIVTEPEITSPQEAKRMLEELKMVLEYIGVSDVKMAEGSLRCDANISVRPRGAKKLGKRVEIKNLNSFRALEAALEYEAKRQIDGLKQGEPLLQEESRGWDEDEGKTFFMRIKEQPEAYRYFPDPDLPPLYIDSDWVIELKSRLPQLPAAKRRYYLEEYQLPEYDAELIISSKAGAEFFEAVMEEYSGTAKNVSNWFLGDLARLLNLEKIGWEQLKIKPTSFVSLLQLLDERRINTKTAKTVLEEMFYTGERPEEIVETKGLLQISDPQMLREHVARVLKANPRSVQDYREGKKKVFQFLVGQIMKETQGKANPELVTDLLRQELGK